MNIDPYNLRYGKVSLPVPREIVPIHLDDEGLAIYTPGGTSPSGHLYPTQIALRYTVPVDPNISLASTTHPSMGHCTLKVEHLDKEMIVTIGMGPAVNDDLDHTHAKVAFHAERDFLPTLKREIAYSRMVAKKNKHRASDCQAPILLVTNADATRALKK